MSTHQNTKKVKLFTAMNTTCIANAPRSISDAFRFVTSKAAAKRIDFRCYENDTLPVTGIGALIAAGSGFAIRGRPDQFVPAGKFVRASMFGPGCPSPARPWPTALG
jgi:hypothetical protein